MASTSPSYWRHNCSSMVRVRGGDSILCLDCGADVVKEMNSHVYLTVTAVIIIIFRPHPKILNLSQFSDPTRIEEMVPETAIYSIEDGKKVAAA